MKRLALFIIICLASGAAFAQNTSIAPVQNTSTDSGVVYRLFATKNMYNFIKLNTRNGRLFQVQWGMESKYQTESILSFEARVSKEEEQNGRFFLYPTSNIYNFIMLDQIDGRAWQVQWSLEAKDRLVDRIN